MPLKKKIKNYLLNNNINSLEQLIDHIEELKSSKDLSIDNRDMLFKLVYYVVNKKDCLLSFFAEINIIKSTCNNTNTGGIKFEDFDKYNITVVDVISNDEQRAKLEKVKESIDSDEFKKQNIMCLMEVEKLLRQEGFPFFSTRKEVEAIEKTLSTYKDSEAVPKLSKESLERLKQPKLELSLGKKETEGKLYYELSWEFIEEMAKRMANNKGDKYPLYNWKNPMTPKGINDLKQAINRHHIEVMKGNYKDGEELLGHVVSYACNSMMLWEQLRDNDENK